MTDRSSRNPEASERKLLQFWRYAMEQSMKAFNFCRPGLVVDYDPATKRARVQVAIDRVLNKTGERIPGVVIANVPVIHLAAGGYVVHVPPAQGDLVLLLFSDRGLEEIKQTYRRAGTDISSLLEEKDAVALPGFGALAQAIPEDAVGGLYAGAEGGGEYVSITPGQVKLVAANIDLDGNVRVSGTATIARKLEANDAASEVGGVVVKSHDHNKGTLRDAEMRPLLDGKTDRPN